MNIAEIIKVSPLGDAMAAEASRRDEKGMQPDFDATHTDHLLSVTP